MFDRRTASALVLAGVFTVVPLASAFADDYPASEFNTTVSDPTPAVGAPFTVTAVGPVGNKELTLTITSPALTDDQIQIAGTKSMTKPTVNGAASFQVTLAGECTCTAVVYDAAGEVISTQKITTDGYVDSTTGGAVTTGTGSTGGGIATNGESVSNGGLTAATGGTALSKSGVSNLELAGLAGVVALGGAGAVGLSAARRRRLARA